MNYVKSLTLAAALFAVSGSVFASEDPVRPSGRPEAPKAGYLAQASNLWGVRHVIGYAHSAWANKVRSGLIIGATVATAAAHKYSKTFRENVSNPVLGYFANHLNALRNRETAAIVKTGALVGAIALYANKDRLVTAYNNRFGSDEV